MRISNKSQTVTRFPIARAGAAFTVSLFALTGCTAGSAESSSEPTTASTFSGSTSSPTQSSGKTGFTKATDSPSASAGASSAADNLETDPGEDKTKEFDFELEFDGEFADYVQATESSRATGVPRPIEPEGMNENTEEGFARFATYYMAERNYAITSGDTAKWREIVTPPGANGENSEIELIDWVDAAYANGGWVVHGHREIYSNRYLVGKSSVGDLSFTVYAVENGTTILNPVGNPPRMEWVPPTQDAYLYQVHGKYIDGKWYLIVHSGDFDKTIPVK